MPIRFRCPRCQQRLSIGSHKTGALIQCPTCKDQVRVPDASEVLSLRGPSTSEPESDTVSVAATSAIPLAELIEPVNDPPSRATAVPNTSSPSPVTAPVAASFTQPLASADVYDSPRAATNSFTSAAWANKLGISKLDHSRVTLPRYVIYTQGLLLGAVGFVCLIFGIALGWKFSPTSSPIDPETLPCVVSGIVEYEDSRGARHPDIGAVVLALPAANQPEKSISSEGLGPDDPQPKSEHPGLRELESLGGRIVRANAAGRFEFRVPRGGNFYIVAISKQTRRDGPHEPKITSTLGKYIAPATKLLGNYQYAMQDPVLREERHVDFFFKRPTPE